MSDESKEKVKLIHFNKKIIYFLLLAFLGCGVLYIGMILNHASLAEFAFSTSVAALTFSAIMGFMNVTSKLDTDLDQEQIRKKNEEIIHIKESIEKFYIPLQVMLTSENMKYEDKKRMMNEINGHKHLALPRARDHFVEYLQSECESNWESKRLSIKLLELISTDLEFLQKQYLLLREQV